MITYGMSTSEIRVEVLGDAHWIIGKANGMMLKYRKEFSRYVPAGKTKLLEVAKYVTPTRKNTVWITWRKQVTAGYKTLSWVTFFERITKDGKRELLLARPSTEILTVFTPHSLDRLNERAGIGFKQFLELMSNDGYASYLESYMYKGKTTLALGFGDYGVFLCEIQNYSVICKTFVSRDLLGDEQKEAQDSSNESGKEIQLRLELEDLEEWLKCKGKK